MALITRKNSRISKKGYVPLVENWESTPFLEWDDYTTITYNLCSFSNFGGVYTYDKDKNIIRSICNESSEIIRITGSITKQKDEKYIRFSHYISSENEEFLNLIQGYINEEKQINSPLFHVLHIFRNGLFIGDSITNKTAGAPDKFPVFIQKFT